MNEDFPTLLKTYRKSMGWTQEELAQKWSYSFETISAWERGKRQNYAYGRGEDTPTLLLKRKMKGGLFDFYAAAAQYILEQSKDISDSTEIANKGHSGGASTH